MRLLGVLVAYWLLAVVAYAPALRGPFQFDDLRVVLDPVVRENVHVGGVRWLP